MKSILSKERTKSMALLSAMVLLSTLTFGQTPRPTVMGAVYGGGRMADVNGSTLVTVVNCDTIGAVFGGNDVAGEVKCGAAPVVANDSSNRVAQVVIGTAATNGTLAIGSVYGGGNGYYSYPTIGTNVTKSELFAGTIQNYAGTQNLFTVAAGLYVPQTKSTKVTVNNNYAQIDSLFGGAKNAFITLASGNSTDITLRGGTLYAVFGGNNYGGALETGSTQNILVKATKTNSASSVNLGGTKLAAKGTAWTSSTPGTVAGHGIRYLFGGGNAAYAPQASITVNGGQIDTLFAGGNAATVGTSTVTVDVASPLYTLTDDNGGPGKAPYYDATTPTPFNVNTSVYDIRCLFGGNNAADMTGTNPSTVTLTQGGIHVVYGGGKQGEMLCGASYTVAGDTRMRSTNVQVASADILIDTVYGGGQSAGTSYDTYVEMTNGKVGTLFGGTNIQGDIPATAKTFVSVSGGHVYESVFGGSNGCYLCLNYTNYLSGNTNHTIPSTYYDWLAGEATPKVWNTDVRISGGQVDGPVYGGGNLAPMGHQDAAFNSSSTQTPGNAHVTISGGTIGTLAGTQVATGYDVNDAVVYTPITGGVYGGANYANIYGYSTLEISGGTIYGDVFGGNDKTGTVTGSLKSGFAPVITTTTTRPSETFADGIPLYSDLNSVPTTVLTRSQTMGAAYVRVTGTPQIHGSLFGGGNGNYNYYQYSSSDGTTKVDVTPSFMAEDPSRPSALKCGNPSLPNQSSALVDLNMGDGAYIDRVFAGGNYATVGVNTYQDGSTQIASAGEATIWFNSAAASPTLQQVGTLFGGNNMVAMDVVPQLYLLQGRAGSIYGGGNQGDMKASANLATAYTLSTYVGLASEHFKVDQNVYGGCKAANVDHESYVYVSRGTVDGHIFGGCDAAGEILTNTRVLVKGDETSSPTLGGNIYGGGNGNYAFYRYDHPNNTAHTTDPHTNPYYIAEHRNDPILYGDLVGRPYCNETYVTIQGKLTLNGNVYGGGVSGDCRETNVLIDAEDGVFNGMIFGAGQGRVSNTGLRVNSNCHDWYIGVAKLTGGVLSYYDQSPAMGNVLETANLTINRFKSMAGSRSTIFGGGESGNVKDVEVQYNATATAHLGSLYAGCLASDVTGRAHMVIGDLVSADAPLIDTVYGGNDFTGKVNETYLEINSGTFEHVFGAGNGDYDYITILDAWDDDATRLASNAGILHKTTCNCYDTVPYSMKVRVDFNGGDFLGTVYGGGNMGLVGDRDMVADNMQDGDAGRDAYIGEITVNVHGGDFHRHVFTGARGKAEMTKMFFDGPAYDDAFVPTSDDITELTTTLGHTPSDEEIAAFKAGKNVDGGTVGKQLAYAFKVLNMDGGRVRFSVYGGSEAVDDGYPYECVGKRYDPATWYDNEVPDGQTLTPHQQYDVNTTKRPSSVLNIIGGEVEKSVYGGGYQGNIYGSVYVNIGVDAVNDSPVWSKTVNGKAYSSYKPNLVGASGATTTVTGNVTLETGEGKPNLTLEASVYNASDWGEAGDKAYFNTRGVYGGETNILVDGKGYNTSQTNTSMMTLPGMLINYSIIGAGTSTEGGDINRLITVRHYGDFVCPDPSKTLASIQRADKVILDSVFIRMEGEQDAYMAYVTPNYSFCRIDTLLFRIDNVVMSGAPAIYIGNLASLRDNEVKDFSAVHLYQNVGDKLAASMEMAEDLLDNLDWNADAAADCGNNNPCHSPTMSLCDKLSTHRGVPGYPGAFNTFVMSNGSYVKVSPFVDKNGNGMDDNNDPDITSVAQQHDFGVVHGWMYMMAQDQTLSYAYAREKTNDDNTTDGGFVSTCYCENKTGSYLGEVDYINVLTGVDHMYRSWERGTEHGDRTRHITLVANAHPDNTLNFELPVGDYPVKLSNGDTIEADETGHITIVSDGTLPNGHSYAYAKATLELPPAKEGSFYLINSVLIDQDNGGQLQLTDQGYESTTGMMFSKEGSLLGDMEAIAGNKEGYKRDYTFGLTFAAGDNFVGNDACWLGTDPDGAGPLGPVQNVTEPQNRSLYNSTDNDYYPCWPISGISGSAYLEDAGGFISPAIGAGVGVIPTLNFTLTYDTRISTTIMRDVIFTLLEYDKNGNYIGPVDVTVTISTVIKEFDDLEAPVMAMYNEGISNEYTRRITIPASFLQRDIFLEGISWEPSTASLADLHFSMQDTNTAIANNKVFSLSIHPTESTSENLTSHLGWYNIETSAIDVYETALTDYQTTTSGDFSAAQKKTYTSLDYNGAAEGTPKTALYGDPILLGTLDGRASAGVDVTLKFDGMRVYYDHYDSPKGPLGYVTLHMRYKNTKLTGPGSEGTFDIKIIVRSRKEGDTIYMAPGPTLSRTVDGTELTMYAYNQSQNNGTGKTPQEQQEKIRNNPDCFVNTLREAMSIYREGDVIDIMETIPVTDGSVPTTVAGDDFSIVQIIRYSGSHFKFPTEACACKGPMIEVKENGILNMRNVWLNGSGCTLEKPGIPTSSSESGAVAGVDYYVPTNQGNVVDGGHTYPHDSQRGKYQEINGLYYYENWKRTEKVLFSDAPILYVHGNGSVNFSSNVLMTNNINHAKSTTANAVLGGAIALKTLTDGEKPEVMLGNKCKIYDNIIVDWNAATTSGEVPATPLNWGAGIYVNGGTLTLGTGSSSSSTGGTFLDIARNFYLHSNSEGHVGLVPKTKIEYNDDDSEKDFTFNVYVIDTLNHPQSFALSNIYLTRTAGSCPGPVRRDAESDVVYFISDMSTNTRVGISKWFPGYLYSGDATHVYTQDTNASFAGYHRLWNDVPRDTVMVARLGKGKSNASMADRVYNSGVFFNDSSYFSQANPVAPATGTAPTFYVSPEEGLTTYSGNTTDNPGYNDHVYLFHHSFVHQFGIYFQRCASFGKGVRQILTTCTEGTGASAVSLRFNDYQKGDSISYRWNADASCVASIDTILFRVGGGFFPYTYHWDYDSIYAEGSSTTPTKLKRIPIRDRVTTGTNNISGLDNLHFTQLRAKAECDTLVLTDLRVHQSTRRSTYFYTATAYDLTGRCPVTQPVIVRVGKVTSDGLGSPGTAGGEYYIDSLNYLRHRNPYAAYSDSADKYYTDYEASTGDFIEEGNHAAGTKYYVNDVAATTGAPSVKLYNKFANQATGYADKYLYYRIKAPGVDSSSFHDHMATNAEGYLVDRVTGKRLYAEIETDDGADTLKYYYVVDDLQPYSTTNRQQGHPLAYVPRHIHSAVSHDPTAHAGVRRAGYSHVPFHHFGLGYNKGTLAQREHADHYVGKPYHDPHAANDNGTDDVEFVDANGVTDAAMTTSNRYLYADEMVPRYLRVFRSYKLSPSIMPVAAQGSVHVYPDAESTEELDLAAAEFCLGDIVHLRPTPKSSSWEYMAWSHDASSDSLANFEVGDDIKVPGRNAPVCYFAPSDYWYNVVTSFENHTGAPTGAGHTTDNTATLDDYDLDYYGNVTIKTNKGLAWLISTVNGYNGQNAHTFHFNTITFDFNVGDAVDMSAHKWTPLGNLNNHFEGTIVCGETANPSDPSIKQTVNGLIVNEKTLPRVGMFGYADGASLSGFAVAGSQMKGNSYVGGLVAESKESTVTDVTLDDNLLIGASVIGGVIANSVTGNTLQRITVDDLTMMGSAIDAGGFIARTVSDEVTNSTADVKYDQLSAITFGGAVSTSDQGGKKGRKSGQNTVLNNNYVRIYTDHNNSNCVGGLVGNASSLEMANCYAHGVAMGQDYVGGIAGIIGTNVSITNCYYANDMSNSKTGYVDYGTPVQNSTSFHGKGKQVVLDQKVSGYTNLLRALNGWVNANGEGYLHWRPAQEGENYNHPLFGPQEMIAVYDTTLAEGCDSYEFEGMDFTEPGNYVFHIVDSSDYLDSTMTLVLNLHYGDSVNYVDTINWGEGYEGQGYHFTDEEIRAGIVGLGQQEVYMFRYVDSLQTAYGCDSLVVLTLYVLGNGEGTGEVPQQLVEVKVYPNPTRGHVTVEGSDLERVEVYDNISRRVLVRDVEGDQMQFDLTNQATGTYYVRVKTAHGTVVKKVVKK